MTSHLDETAAGLQAQGRALRALARSILRSTEGADDVVQEAFAAALAAAPAAAHRAGWLVRVVQNLARRRLRDRARRRLLSGHLPPPAPAPAPDDVLAQVETHRLVAEAVLRLGEPFRRALVLRYWHDLPPRAIARRLGIPVATVKTHLQRGLAELRQRLDRRGERRAWLAALVPLAHPHLAGAAGLAAPAIAALAAMNLKQLSFALVAGLCLGVLVWRGREAPALPAPAPATSGGPAAARGELDGRTREGTDADRAATGPTTAAGPTDRLPATRGDRTCTVVGRIVTAAGLPAADARIRLVHLWERPASPPLAAAAAADGTFALDVPRPHDWIPYTFALADAPGWAVRELHLDAAVQDSIAGDRLDLGTFRLERGVAVTGRVLEADGAPLRARARLLAWDPVRSGSWAAMYGGRTVGFAEPGGRFALADRLSAGRNGTWMLAAVSATGVGWAALEFAAGQDHLDPVEIRLLPGGGVDVRVVDGGGAPVAGARVQAVPYFRPIGLAPMWEPTWGRGGTPHLAEVEALFVRRSDHDGRVRFANLPRRQHPDVRDANRDQPSVEAIVVSASKAGHVTDHATVDPVPGGAADVTIALGAQRRVAFHGTVATADGTRLPGVTVRLNGGDLSSVTDAGGRYALPERAYQGNRAWFLIEGGDVPLTHAQADIPPDGERIAHDFVVERRAPVTGRVVDQSGAPVAGVALHLGVEGGTHQPSTPERTGADGAFAFPDATASHTDLWVRPPEPRSAWRPEPARKLTRRDGEVVTLHRLDGPLVDLTLTIADGRDGAPVSPTEVDLHRLHGSSRDRDTPHPHVALALGAATARQLRPGRYRATVRAADGLQATREFAVPADAPQHRERIELWPPTAVVCTVDATALHAGELARHGGDTLLVLLDSQAERSYAVDAAGERLNYTPNTGAVRLGGETTFRLERVTPDVPLRLHVPNQGLWGEVWFRAAPGTDAHVTLRLVPAGHVAFELPAAWPAGAFEIDVHDGEAWRPLASGRHGGDGGAGARSWPRPAGEVRWRVRLWPADGGDVAERTGTAAVLAGGTAAVRVE